jgi:enoyl-CoA hydratase
MINELVKVVTDKQISTIILNNPPVNALNPHVLETLHVTLKDLYGKAELQGLIITGSGQAFSAGADLKFFNRASSEELVSALRLGQEVFNTLEMFSVPTMAAVNGAALGGGFELTLACDFRVASDEAVFGLPEVTIGMIPGWGGTQRLPELVGVSRAKSLIYSGRIINANEAADIGLVEQVVSKANLFETSKEVLLRLLSRSAPLAVRSAKASILAGLRGARFAKGSELEVKEVTKLFRTNDLKEGLQAFLEKRRTNFTGS